MNLTLSWRNIRRYAFGLIAAVVSLGWLTNFSFPSLGEAPIDNKAQSIKLTAALSKDPSEIILNWTTNEGDFQLYRKEVGEDGWGIPRSVGSAQSYTDSDVEQGVLYEYMVRRKGRSRHKGNVHVDRAFIVTGIDVPPAHDRGVLLLMIEQSVAEPLAVELDQLEADLIGDGWQVTRHLVAQSMSPQAVKALIVDEYSRSPEQVKAVYLLGHVPVPYSGNHAEDYHEDRAFPADIYYGDMDGEWTDVTVNNPRTTNPNIPGDGVFDQIAIDDKAANQKLAPELAVGRVDFYDMPTFAPLTEVDLLRRYLDKAHRWRHGEISLPPRGLISDRLGQFRNSRRGGEGAWRNLVPMVGEDAITEGAFSSAVNSDGYLWAFATSTGGYTAIYGGFNSHDFRSIDPPVAFYHLLGSYFGDWDTTNNLLRATLAAPTYGLASVWGSWGRWQFHQMAFGSTIGESMQATHDPARGYRYYEHGHRTMVEMNLMGDPTLRLHPFRPVSQVRVDVQSTGEVMITWQPSPDATGYFVYRRDSKEEPFVLLDSRFTEKSFYLDSSPSSTDTVYMVRATRMEKSPSGSYRNLAQGIHSDNNR